MSTFTAIKSMLLNQNWRLMIKTFNYWYIRRSVADSVCSWCRGPLRMKLPKFIQKLCFFLSINWLTYELIHKGRSFWDWNKYTQYPIIRNGHIRNTSEIWGYFKRRLVSRLNLRNALKKLRNTHWSRFLG